MENLCENWGRSNKEAERECHMKTSIQTSARKAFGVKKYRIHPRHRMSGCAWPRKLECAVGLDGGEREGRGRRDASGTLLRSEVTQGGGGKRRVGGHAQVGKGGKVMARR